MRNPTDEVVSVTGVAADEDRDGAFVPERIADGPVQVPPGEEADVTVEGTVRGCEYGAQDVPLAGPDLELRSDGGTATQVFDLADPGRDPGAGLLMALRWVLFDLNGTLVDTAVMAQPLGDTAADEDLVSAAVDDAIQLAMVVTLTGREAEFSELVRAGLRRRLRLAGRDPSAADDALGLMGAMPAFIDAPAALEQLRGIGLRLGVLTQSTAAAADARAALRGPARPDRDRDQRAGVGRLQAGPAALPAGARARRRRRRTRSRWSPRTGGTWPAPRRPGCGRAGSPAATSCCPTACRSPTSAAATCSRSRRAWPSCGLDAVPKRGISRRAAAGGSCAG